MAVGSFSWRPYWRQQRDESLRYYQHQLYTALENRDQAGMLTAINNGACWKIPNLDGETVIHMVVKKTCGHPDEQKEAIKIIEWFLKHKKINVDFKERGGKTALHLAVKNRMIEVVDYLIKKGADLNARDNRGNWVAHYMVEGEFERYMELTRKTSSPDKLRPFHRESVHFFSQMLSKKIKIDCANKTLETPLQIAAKRNLLHVMPILLQHTENVSFRDKDRKTALHLFAENKKRSEMVTIKTSCYDRPLLTDILIMMLNKGFSVNSMDVYGNSPLHKAVCQDEPELIEMMLKRFKKMNACNYEGNTVLHLVIDNCIELTSNQHREGYANFVRTLVTRGTDIDISNKHGHKPLQLAVMRVHPTILQILKDHGADLREKYNGGNLLHLLSQKSSEMVSSSKLEDVIGLLVSQGCDVNARDRIGMTPMHLAAQSRRNVIGALVKCHANVDARELSEHRFTPLQVAVVTNNGYSINTLVSVGADVNAKDSTGMTALHWAMKYENGTVKALLRLGAHVEVEDDEKLLPLHHAIKKKNGMALPELLKFGANINDVEAYRELVSLKDPGCILFAILEHWIKMKAAGLPVASGYRAYASGDTSFQELYQECLKEVEDLKAYEIGDRTSLYDLLHMDWNFRCAYTVNKPFKDLIESTILQTTFPKYHVLILASYHEAVARQPLLEPAKRAWHEFTKIMLPDVCVYRILAHLNNRDLRVMVEGSKDRSFRKPCNLLLNKKGRSFNT